MGWSVAASPENNPAVYFIFLPTSNKCLFANDLNSYTDPMTNYGDVSGLEGMYPSCPLIPIDPHHALSLDWITLDDMVMEMPYVTDSLKACLRLIKDIKDEGNGDDTEGLRTSS